MQIPKISPESALGVCSIEEARNAPKIAAEELRLAQRFSSESRQSQFIAGRIAAHRALQSAGADAALETTPILRADDGAPVFPAAWRGSISHTRSVAIGFAACAARYRGCAVDVERCDRATSAKLIERIAGTAEIAALDGAAYGSLRMFSAKEAALKLLKPVSGKFPALLEVQLLWNEASSSFQGSFGASKKERECFEVRSFIIDGFIISCTLLGAR